MNDYKTTCENLQLRIAQLNSKTCNSAKKLEETMQEIIKLESQLAYARTVSATVDCMKEYAVEGTPIASGRARAGWYVTADEGQTSYAPPEKATPAAYARLIQDNTGNFDLENPGTIYVINNVPYIQALNSGWSKRQAGNFIDLFLLNLKSKLEKIAQENK